MDITKLIAIFFIGVLGSFIGAMAGSGGLISIPFLILAGLPPQVAIATHKFGSAGLKLGALTRFWRTPNINWQYFIPFSIIGFCAAIVGTQILIAIDKALLQDIVAILLLAVLPVLFLNKDTGVMHRTTSVLRKMLGYIFYFLAQVFGAFFGGGAATIVFYILMTFFGLTIIEASATTMLPSLIMTLTSLLMFAAYGILDYPVGIVLFCGMLVGGWLGAHTAIKVGSLWVKLLFVVLVVVSAIKLLME